ncbi:uncharacterized protein LOC6602227 isoform X1 [Drosophila persimilis]|uniref:uncharacterized protein LOC6602227 isoform X1 n=2 Tax=Drosophila persimilis TaxID=7234 RepID=UPI000F08ABD8|nr:uncharacterized protein LOC6602227 isoform X1 [Drosophila persimilis]
MEAKFLASALSFLSIFLAIYAQSLANDLLAETSDEGGASASSTELFEVTPAIYYGDSNVNLGEPFSITCIIPITEKIHWLKNGEPITRHNLRHGRDEHAYTLAESAIEGEKHKIEAHLSVRHALKVHEGRYQCNHRHGSYHMLHVRGAASPGGGEATESGYQTIDELTPNSADDIFTRTWLEQQQTGVGVGVTPPHHQQQPEQHQHQHKQHKAHPFYGNASRGDLTVGPYVPMPPPTSRYNDLTTLPWHPSSTATGVHGLGGGIHRVYSATPPDFPPPRLNMMEHTVAPPEPPTILYNQTLPHHRQRPPITAIVTATATDSSAGLGAPPSSTLLSTAHHHSHHQQQLQQQAQHTLNAFQLPLPPPVPYPAQSPAAPVPVPAQNERYQTYAPHFVPPVVGGGGAAAAPTTTTAIASMGGGQMRQQPKTVLSAKLDTLVPNYDNVEHEMKFYDIRGPLVLSCNVKSDSTDPLIWKKNHTDVMNVDVLKGRFKLINAERKFIIDRAEAYDDGLYSCEINGVSRDINVIARVVVRVPSNTAVVEGEKMSVTCSVVGSAPQLSWTFGNVTLKNNTDRFVLKADNNIENAILTLDNVTLDDRGEYKCIGRNAANDFGNSTVASDFTTVRVKGKFAALWPFLGICAEVLILCLIILIYEKRRNKSELEESDTDPQEQKKKRRNYD